MVHPHRKLRSSCQSCTLPEGRKHNSDTERFHGVGSFCRTHSTTQIGRAYCYSDGTSKQRTKKSSGVYKKNGAYYKKTKSGRKRVWSGGAWRRTSKQGIPY